MDPEQAGIDERVLRYYGDAFDEHARLTVRSQQGPLELRRTQEVIGAHTSGGRVVDVGGGTGVHARALLELGYTVELVDPVPRHVEAARSHGVPARTGDARRLPFGDDAFDVALLLGPLYHLASQADRLLALREAVRTVRPGGLVFAAGISRFATLGTLALGREVPDPLPPAWAAVLSRGEPPASLRFPAGHYHTAEELQQELELAGLLVREVVGVEGPGGLLLESSGGPLPDEVADAALVLARASASVPGIRDLSAHLLAVGVVPGAGGAPRG